MSRKYILNSADKTLSPSQVYLEKLSSGVFRDLFSSGSRGYNTLLQREEVKKSPKRSLYRRPKTKAKCGASFAKRKTPSSAPKQVRVTDGASKPAPTDRLYSCSLPKAAADMAVAGSSLEISPRALPKLRETCASKGPSTLRAAVPREAESARKPCVLSAVKPTNVEGEKVKFFKSGFSYNPQFQYSNPASALVLARHNSASDRFLTQVSSERLSSPSQATEGRQDLQVLDSERLCDSSSPPLQAVHIMELVLQRYGSYEAFERVTGGGLLTKSRIWHNVKKYMEKEGCVGEVGERRSATTHARDSDPQVALCATPSLASGGRQSAGPGSWGISEATQSWIT